MTVHISLEKVSRIYRMPETEVVAVSDVELLIDEGEYVAITGASGSGKSTLMAVIGCLDRATSGNYLLAGRPTQRLGDNELAALRNREIGFVFQQFHLLQRETALENVALPLIYADCPLAERLRRSREMLERVGLGERLLHKPPELSGGQQQRVAIARALVMRPRLLLADEPTGALDSATSEEILQLLADVNRASSTVIIVTHDRSVAAHAGRTIRLHDGRVVDDARAPRIAVR
ncbi:ABC transporter ATP-binding protein [Rhodopseudomonas palustris]|uniref:ABC transporter related n=1 Tax=Rhodopseudomonas palustris (strain BisB18) TaxID=316056 RepID=Q216U3_RHOPB